MFSVNEARVIGNLGDKPDFVTKSKDGKNYKIATFSVATNKVWKDANGEKHQKTNWHRIVAYGNAAENSSKYLKKGSLVEIFGELRTDRYLDKDGIEKYSTSIIVSSPQGRINFLDKKEDEETYVEDIPFDEIAA